MKNNVRVGRPFIIVVSISQSAIDLGLQVGSIRPIGAHLLDPIHSLDAFVLILVQCFTVDIDGDRVKPTLLGED